MFVYGRASGTFTVSRILLLFCRDIITRRVGTTTLIILLLLLYARYLSLSVAAVVEGQFRVRPRYLLPTYFHLQLQYVVRIPSRASFQVVPCLLKNVLIILLLSFVLRPLSNNYFPKPTLTSLARVNENNRHRKSARRL